MKYNIKQSSLLMLFALFLVTFCFIACDDQDNEAQEQVGQLTPEALWEDYDEFDITYTIEGSYITFNDIAFQLAGAPWVIKSYTKNHITLIQNEASPDKDKIATIELDRVD